MDYGENEVQEYDFYYMLHRREDGGEDSAWRVLPVSWRAVEALASYTAYFDNENWYGFACPTPPIEYDLICVAGLRGCYIDHYDITPRP